MDSDNVTVSSVATPTTNVRLAPVAAERSKPQWTATLALTVCVLATLLLSLADLNAIGLPGCSAGSGCDAASKSVWGKLPGLGWPTAYIGFAWFSGVFVWWMLSGQNGRFVTTLGRTLLRASVVGSMFFLTVSWIGGYLCWYCIAANVANILFVSLLEWSWRTFARTHPTASVDRVHHALRGRSTTGGIGGVIAALLITGALAVLQVRSLAAAKLRDQAALAQSTAKILEATAKQAEVARLAGLKDQLKAAAPGQAGQANQAGQAGSAPQNPPAAPVAESARPLLPEPLAATNVPFTGRHRLGPEVAQVRLVVFTGYQCPDCKVLEAELVRIAAANPTVSMSVKHFPLCAACNPQAGTNMHPNACWAARFTEAAAILGGPEKFWAAHKLMFEVGGSFTDAEFPKLVQKLGLSIKVFSDKMQSKETLDRVAIDIASGYAVGITMTPMLFVNGVELRGAHLPGAAESAVTAVLATNPTARDASADVPPGAFDRAVGAWRNARAVAVAPEPNRSGFGATSQDATVTVVLIGDLQEPLTGAADAELRGLTSELPGLRYEYRHYPMDKKCQPVGVVDRYPQACMAARAVEAAGLLGGEAAMQSLHVWLVNNRERLTEQSLRDGVPAIGLNADDLFAKLTDPVVDARIAADIALAKRLGVKSLPSVWVNGKPLVTLKAGGRSALAAVVREAVVQPLPPK